MLVALSFPAEAQQSATVPRIGYLTGGATPDGQSTRIEAFRQSLRELGYVEGENIVIECRSAKGKLDRLPALVIGVSSDLGNCISNSDGFAHTVLALLMSFCLPFSFLSSATQRSFQVAAGLYVPQSTIAR